MKPRLGQRLIKALTDLRDNTPMRQTIMRRMTVKGKTVYTRETFTAPLR